jgi:DNA excision repair protein ERCC-8
LRRHYNNTLSLDADVESFLLTGSSDGLISLFSLVQFNSEFVHHQVKTKPVKKKYFHASSISSINWYPFDKNVFMSSSYDGTISVHDCNQFSCVDSFTINNPVYKAKFNVDGTLVAGGLLNGSIVLCDPNTGDSTHTILGHNSTVTGLDWCPHSSHLLASSSTDGSVRIWDIRKGGRNSLLLSLDWRQDNTAYAYSTKKNIHDDDDDVISFRRIDWNKVETNKANDGPVYCVKVIIFIIKFNK